jgi:hypothetical protein
MTILATSKEKIAALAHGALASWNTSRGFSKQFLGS